MPVWAEYESESTLFCGKGVFNSADNFTGTELVSLYDELNNVCYMPEWLWKDYFGKRLDRDNLQNWIDIIGREMKQKDLSTINKIYGWWYHWSHYTTINIENSETDKIVILVPDFREGGPARILILPEDMYRKNRERFPEFASAISIGEEPQISAGAWTPDNMAWESVKKWLALNREKLLSEIFY